MNTTVAGNLKTEEKVNIIFSYLFSENKSNEEELFWNKLKKEEIHNLEKINNQDETFDFNSLKSEILGK